MSPIFSFSHSGGKIYQMGDVIHGPHPDYLFLLNKKGSLGVIHEQRHPFFSFTDSGGKIYQMGNVIHGWHPDYLLYCIVLKVLMQGLSVV